MAQRLETAERTMRRGSRRPATRRAAATALSVCLAAACGGGGGGAGIVPGPDAPLATARIGPAGGTVEVLTGPHAGTSLTVRPGTVGAELSFAILVDRDEACVPSMFPVYRFEPAGVTFPRDSIAVTVRAAAPFFHDASTDAPNLTVFSRPGSAEPFEALRFSVVDELAQTVTASPTRLGRFVAWDGDLHRLFTQRLELVDPSVETATETLFGVEVTVANGSDGLFLGRGSLASFWSSPARENVLILHGLSGSPLDFRGPNDLIASLPPSVHNIVLAVYPSATGVVENANALYDLIRSRQQPGFGCTIIGHSLGGLIGRYMIERSAADPARANVQPGDAPLSDVVPALVMMGTPNSGSAVAASLFAALLPNLPPADERFARAGVDLLEGPGTFLAELNASYVDNPTVYHTVCGDLGNGSDGIVSVASARALPVQVPETERVFPVGHFNLHRDAGSNGVAAWLATLLPQ